jgi:allantoin racemase
MSPPELLYLVPGRPPDGAEQRRRQRVADARVPASVTVEWVGEGPTGIESAVEEAWSVPGLLRVAAAREDDVDALVVGCFGDTGVRPLRELLSIPVVGPAAATVSTAVQLADRFSWLTPLDRTVPMARALARELGVTDRLTSVVSLDLSIDAMTDQAALEAALVEAGRDAVENDGAEALVSGCMSVSFAERHDAVATQLPVPLFDSLTLALEQASTWARHGMTHSERSYPPTDRDRIASLLDDS